MHWIDHYWLVMPQLGATVHDGYKRDGQNIETTMMNVMPGVTELLLFIGMAAIFVASFCLIAGNRSLVPLKDPRLHEALNYDNP